MNASVHGRIERSVIAAIGVWDPLLPVHLQLLDLLRARAHRQSLSPVVFVIDPDPARFLWGPAFRPVYTDPHARVQQMLDHGLDAVVRVHFARRDLDATAADFFSLVDAYAHLAEVWLGAKQSLGRCAAGNADAIGAAAAARGTKVFRLPYRPIYSRKIRDLLQSGHLAKASRIVGRPPIQSRPASDKLRLAWCPGRYGAIAIEEPNAAIKGRMFRVSLKREPRQLPVLDWPAAGVKYLAFVHGPGDPVHEQFRRSRERTSEDR
jgi:hypothetical protein